MADTMNAEVPVTDNITSGSFLSNEEQVTEVVDYLSEEISGVLSGAERGDLVEKWGKWRRQSEGRPESATKDYPWPGASNVVPPISLINANGVTSMVKNSINKRKPLWLVEDTTGDYPNEARAITEFLAAMAQSKNHLNLYAANNTMLYDLVRLGTQFVKVPWMVNKRPFKRTNPQSGALEQVELTIKDAPAVIPIKIEDFITRPFWYDIQTAPWIAIRWWLTEPVLRSRGAQGIYQNVDKVLDEGGVPPDDTWTEILRRAGIDPSSRDTKLFPIFECYYFYDVDGDGVPEDIKVWIDPRSKTILRSELNEMGIRDIVRIPYFDLPYSLYGMGTGWITETLQDEGEALHNIKVNALHLSSLQMYVTKKGTRLGPMGSFRPLKNIEVDNPPTDFMPVKFPDIGYSVVQAEMMVKEYADRATGAGDYQMGFENPALSSRNTLGGTQLMLSQGAKVFSSVLPNIENGISEIGQLAVFQCIYNKDRVEATNLMNLIPAEDVPFLKNVLEMDPLKIPHLFNFRVETTDQEKTEDAKKQSLLALIQLYTMFGEKIFQLAPIVYNPQSPQWMKELAMKFFVGSTNLMEEVMKDFNAPKLNEALPYVKDMEMLINALDQMRRSGGGLPQGGANVPANSTGMGSGGMGGSNAGLGPGANTTFSSSPGTPIGGQIERVNPAPTGV